jgi:hypothetical protein
MGIHVAALVDLRSRRPRDLAALQIVQVHVGDDVVFDDCPAFGRNDVARKRKV